MNLPRKEVCLNCNKLKPCEWVAEVKQLGMPQRKVFACNVCLARSLRGYKRELTSDYIWAKNQRLKPND